MRPDTNVPVTTVPNPFIVKTRSIGRRVTPSTGRPPTCALTSASARRNASRPSPVLADTGTMGAPSRNEPAASSRTSRRTSSSVSASTMSDFVNAMWPAVPTTTDFIVFVYSRLPSSAFAHLSLVATGTLFARLLALRRGFAAPRTPLALAHALENLHQAEVHLAHLHVDADHLHFDLVAKTIDLVRVLASEQVRTLHEPVIVVRHRRHVHEPFDEVLDQLDEQTECRYAGDVAFELIADFVGHELHFFPLHELTLGIVAAAFHLRRISRHLRQLLGQLFPRVIVYSGGPCPPVAQQPMPRSTKRAMDDEVGITTDRRGEMRVARGREPEVPEVFWRVARLLHRPQHEKRNRLLFGLAVDSLDELLEVTRAKGACRRGEAVAEAGDELLELGHLQNVRLFVNAIERRRVL